MNLNAKLDLAKARNDIRSDRELSERLGCSPGTVNQYRRHNVKPSLDVARVLAELCGEDPEIAILDLEIWRHAESDERTLRILTGIRDKIADLSKAATAALFLIGTLGFSALDAEAASYGRTLECTGTSAQHAENSAAGLYIMGNKMTVFPYVQHCEYGLNVP